MELFDKGHVRTSDEQIPLLQDRARRRQHRNPEIVQLRLSAAEHAALVIAAKAKQVRVSTLVLDVLRANALLGHA